MNILLDTHIILWSLYAPEKLPSRAVELISDPSNWLYCSRLSLWECEIKHLKHPEAFAMSAGDVMEDCHRAGFYDLPLESRHIITLSEIGQPVSKDHKDPFDRMLMAQAVSENMAFLTHDSRLPDCHISNIVYV